jgi:hypothetical protein
MEKVNGYQELQNLENNLSTKECYREWDEAEILKNIIRKLKKNLEKKEEYKYLIKQKLSIYKNPKYYTSEDEIIAIKQENIRNVSVWLGKVKRQTSYKGSVTIQNKIKEIESLVQKDTLSDSFKAVLLTEKEYTWRWNGKETFISSLTDFERKKDLFEQERQYYVTQSRVGLIQMKHYLTQDRTGQTQSLLAKIEALVKEETNKDAQEAIRLLSREYIWVTSTGKTFVASPSYFGTELYRNEEEERQKTLRIKEEKIRQEQVKIAQKKEDREGCLFAFLFCLSLVVVIIIIIALIANGFWGWGIFVTIIIGIIMLSLFS